MVTTLSHIDGQASILAVVLTTISHIHDQQPNILRVIVTTVCHIDDNQASILRVVFITLSPHVHLQTKIMTNFRAIQMLPTFAVV